MKVLFFFQHFHPDSPPYANMLRSLGSSLGTGGHEVMVLAGQPSHKLSDRQTNLPGRECVSGMEVRRLRRLPFAARSPAIALAQRILFPIQAFLTVLVMRARGKRFDIVLAATMPPVLNGLFGLFSARVLGARFVYHMQDIYPEIAICSGMLKASSPLARSLLAVDTWIANSADRCVVLSDDMAEAIRARRGSRVQPTVINNLMLSGSEVDGADRPLERQEGARVRPPYRLVFAGNMGRHQRLQEVLSAFLEFDESGSGLELHFMGDGTQRSLLEEMATGSASVIFHSQRPFREAADFIESCDAGLMSIRPGLYRYAYPSKLITYTGLGVPVFLVIENESQLARDATAAGVGIVADTTSRSALVQSFDTLLHHLSNRDDLRQATIAFHEKEFSTARVLDAWHGLFERLAAPVRSNEPS